MIRVKVEYQGENRFFHLPITTTTNSTNSTTLMPSLDQLLSQHVLPLFHLSPSPSTYLSSYQVKYRDHENDYITMDQEHEWREALQQQIQQQSGQSNTSTTSTTSTNDQSFCCLHLKLVNLHLQHDNNNNSNHVINQQYNNNNNENEATVTSHPHSDKTLTTTTATTNEKKKKNKDVTNDLLLLDDSATWYLSHLSHSPDNDHNDNDNDNDHQNLTFHSCRLVSHHEPMFDGTVLSHDQIIEKRWLLKNTGEKPWPNTVQLSIYPDRDLRLIKIENIQNNDDDDDGKNSNQVLTLVLHEVNIPIAQPGESVMVSIKAQMPSFLPILSLSHDDHKMQSFKCYFRLKLSDSASSEFGDTFWFDFSYRPNTHSAHSLSHVNNTAAVVNNDSGGDIQNSRHHDSDSVNVSVNNENENGVVNDFVSDHTTSPYPPTSSLPPTLSHHHQHHHQHQYQHQYQQFQQQPVDTFNHLNNGTTVSHHVNAPTTTTMTTTMTATPPPPVIYTIATNNYHPPIVPDSHSNSNGSSNVALVQRHMSPSQPPQPSLSQPSSVSLPPSHQHQHQAYANVPSHHHPMNHHHHHPTNYHTGNMMATTNMTTQAPFAPTTSTTMTMMPHHHHPHQPVVYHHHHHHHGDDNDVNSVKDNDNDESAHLLHNYRLFQLPSSSSEHKNSSQEQQQQQQQQQQCGGNFAIQTQKWDGHLKMMANYWPVDQAFDRAKAIKLLEEHNGDVHKVMTLL